MSIVGIGDKKNCGGDTELISLLNELIHDTQNGEVGGYVAIVIREDGAIDLQMSGIGSMEAIGAVEVMKQTMMSPLLMTEEPLDY